MDRPVVRLLRSVVSESDQGRVDMHVLDPSVNRRLVKILDDYLVRKFVPNVVDDN